jgi:hypothetical protein
MFYEFYRMSLAQHILKLYNIKTPVLKIQEAE